MGIVSKILHKDKHHENDVATTTSPTNTTTSGSHGVGSSTTTSGLPSTGTTGLHSSSNNTTTGPHSTNTANKADPRIDSSNNHLNSAPVTGSHGYGSDNYGPHSSNTGNKVDPRVDSDHSRYGSTTTGQHGLGSDTYGRHDGYNTTSGPHASDMANKADPRVDSDNSRYGAGGAPPTTGAGLGHSNGLTSGAGQNFSNRDPYPNTGSNTRDPYTTSHVPGAFNSREDYGPTGPASHTIGPHSSNAANTVDPRVRPEPEKMRDHKTAGPHQSDMLNKLDPRVDSDPRTHGYDDHNRYGSTGHNVQTGGLVGGPHERLENRGSIPTAGGLPVGDHGNGPYGSSHGTGLTGSHGTGLTGSHGAQPHGTSHGGLTGSHGRDAYDTRSNEPLGTHDRSGHSALSSGHSAVPGHGLGSHTVGTGGQLSDLEYKEREIALRQKELDLKEREMRIHGH